MKTNNPANTNVYHAMKWCRLLISFVIIFSATSTFALTCGRPQPQFLLRDPDTAKNIVVGVITEAHLEEPAKAGQGPVVGRLQILETLRGASRENVRVTTRDIDGAYGGILRMGVPYLVFLSDDADAEFVIGPCNKPLRLDPQNVVYGDGCLLYEYRAMLNIAQSRSWACEVINRRMSRTRNAGDYDSEAEAEALNRAMWKDLGVDWSR